MKKCGKCGIDLFLFSSLNAELTSADTQKKNDLELK